jgi:predicted Mrr-cat superfamily restriction endonuclease
MSDTQQAFILRIAPSRIDRVDEALKSNQIIIGWSEAQGLLKRGLSWEQFRQIIQDTYYSQGKDFRRAGKNAGNMWNFTQKMKTGDLVVVPHGPRFYIAEVAGEAIYESSRVNEDTAYRRPVKWLNRKQPIPRNQARVALASRMKVYQTCVDATDLIDQINEVLKESEAGKPSTFYDNLHQKLTKQALEEIRSGKMEPFAFQKLLERLLNSLGAKDTRIVPTRIDQGADIVARFSIANVSSFVLAVQAKHFQPTPPVDAVVIDQLLKGMESESADLGWVVTSGSFSKGAINYAKKLFEDKSIRIELVDGEQLASLILESGILYK